MGGLAMRDLEAVKIDGVNLRADALMDLLTKMDAAGEKGACERRSDERFSYRRNGLLVHLSQPDVTLVVASRNLSISGFSFLYRQMLYPGTACTVELLPDRRRTADEQPVTAKGKVISCRHIQGMVHEIGVRFNKELDDVRMSRLVGQDAAKSSHGAVST